MSEDVNNGTDKSSEVVDAVALDRNVEAQCIISLQSVCVIGSRRDGVYIPPKIQRKGRLGIRRVEHECAIISVRIIRIARQSVGISCIRDDDRRIAHTWAGKVVSNPAVWKICVCAARAYLLLIEIIVPDH
jgi:hypothetical protein